MGLGHSIDANLESNLFGFNGCANRIAKVNLSIFFFRMRENGAVLSFSFDFSQLLDIFHVFLVSLGIPENNTKFNSVCFLIGENEGTIR